MEANEKAREYIGKSIALLRSIKRMTGKELAEKAGIHQPNVVKIENGQINVGLDILESIAASMDCHVDLVDNRTGMVPTVLRELYVKTYGTTSADDTPGKHPMTKEQIEAFMAKPSKYGVPPIATPQSPDDGSCVSIPLLVQVIAQMGGYRVMLEKI